MSRTPTLADLSLESCKVGVCCMEKKVNSMTEILNRFQKYADMITLIIFPVPSRPLTSALAMLVLVSAS